MWALKSDRNTPKKIYVSMGLILVVFHAEASLKNGWILWLGISSESEIILSFIQNIPATSSVHLLNHEVYIAQ